MLRSGPEGRGQGCVPGLPTEHLPHTPGVRGGDHDLAVQPPGPRRGLVLEQVVTVRLTSHDLAGGGDAEPLACPAVRLVLGILHPAHRGSLLVARAVAAGGGTGGQLVVEAGAVARSAASCSARSRARPAARSARASVFFRCGPNTMIILRPSCFGADST